MASRCLGAGYSDRGWVICTHTWACVVSFGVIRSFSRTASARSIRSSSFISVPPRPLIRSASLDHRARLPGAPPLLLVSGPFGEYLAPQLRVSVPSSWRQCLSGRGSTVRPRAHPRRLLPVPTATFRHAFSLELSRPILSSYFLFFFFLFFLYFLCCARE